MVLSENIIDPSILTDAFFKAFSSTNIEQLIAYTTSTSIMWIILSSIVFSLVLIGISRAIYLICESRISGSDAFPWIFSFAILGLFSLIVFCATFDTYIQITRSPDLWATKHIVNSVTSALTVLIR